MQLFNRVFHLIGYTKNKEENDRAWKTKQRKKINQLNALVWIKYKINKIKSLKSRLLFEIGSYWNT